jgi:hypothetical protein
MASAALMVRVNTTYEVKGAFLIAMWLQKPMCVCGVYAARQLGGRPTNDCRDDGGNYAENYCSSRDTICLF